MSKTKKALFVAFVISLSAIMLLLSGCGAAPKTTVEPTVTRAPEPVVEVADEPDVDITYTMAADLNGDGLQDCVLFSNGEITIILTQSAPCHERFSQPLTINGVKASMIALGDQNDNGTIDIVYIDYVDGSPYVLPGRGNGYFEKPQPLYERIYGGSRETLSLTGQILIIDTEGDGTTELVELNGDTIKIWNKDLDYGAGWRTIYK